MKSSMTFIQSNGCTEIDLILKQIWRRFIWRQVSFNMCEQFVSSMDKGLVDHFDEPAMNLFIWIFVHLRNPINVRQIDLLTRAEGGKDRFVVVQHLWCRKICQIVCRVSRKWMESKFQSSESFSNSLRTNPSVQPSLYPFYSQNCLHISNKVSGSTAQQPIPEVGSIICGS